MAADEKESKPKKGAPDGAWVVVDDQKQVLAVERSELRAWRIAGPLKAVVVRWPFGKSRSEVLG
jgi:hypothetical protein